VANKYTAQIFHEFDERLKSVWLDIQERCELTPFQTYEWLSIWNRTVGMHRLKISPLVFCIYYEQLPVALFPYGIRNVFGLRVLEYLGGDQADYNAPLVCQAWTNQERFEAIWNTLLDELPQYDVSNFTRMPEKVGEHVNPLIAMLAAHHQSYAYSARLTQSWEEFSARLPKKMLKDNSRMMRRLNDLGRVEFKTASSSEEFIELVETMFEQKRRRCRETGVRDIMADGYVRDFYRTLRQCTSGRFVVNLSALKVDDEILATTLGVIFRNNYSYLVPTYIGGDYAKFSPGRLLLEYLVKSSVDEHLTCFDFTVGSEAYKTIWCDQQISLYRRVEGRSMIGSVFVIWLGLVEWVKKNQYSRAAVTTVVRLLRGASSARK